MLMERLNEPFKMVCWRQLALVEHEDINDDVIAQYIETRDLSILPPLEELGIAVFSCLPLKTEYEHLLKPTLEGNQETAWSLFAAHVTGAEDYNHADGLPVLDWKTNNRGRRIVRKKCRDDVLLFIRNEITGLITDKAAVGDYGPFGLPGTFYQDMITFRTRRVMIAARNGAKSPADKSTKKDQAQ